MRELVQEPMKTRSMAISSIGVPGFKRHVVERAFEGAWRSGFDVRGGRIGHVIVTGTTMPGLVPQVTYGASLRRASITSSRSKTGAGIGGQGPPMGDGFVPVGCPCGAKRRPFR